MLPRDHLQRHSLSGELHARPPLQFAAPVELTYLVLMTQPGDTMVADALLNELTAFHDLKLTKSEAPGPYVAVKFPPFRFKRESHNEFTTYTFIENRQADARAGLAQIEENLPKKWLERLPGQLIAAVKVHVYDANDLTQYRRFEAANYAAMIVGAATDQGTHQFCTDFRVGADGLTRFHVLATEHNTVSTGNLVQRLLEIETYRMMALLAFPVARDAGVILSRAESRLAALMETLTQAHAAHDDNRALNELIALAAQVEKLIATSQFRFSAATAYYELVNRRIADLNESEIPGKRTIARFMQRRLAPAMNTCAATARRQADLSARIARASQLLRTRVDVAREEQNQSLLASMNTRAKLQLRLQQTVEGLSIAAITYYSAGLVGYIAKMAKAAGLDVHPDIIIGIAIPLIAVATWWQLRVHKRHIEAESDEAERGLMR